MRLLAFCCSLCSLLLPAGAADNNQNDSETSFVLQNVSVIDVENGRLEADLDIVISDNQIISVQPTGTTHGSNVRTIDCTGMYAIPGLWDMMVHLTDTTELALPALLANGVTGVRDLGGDIDFLESLQQRTSSGQIPGPHIFHAGPYLDSAKGGLPWRQLATTPEEARASVRLLAETGVDFLKMHNGVTRDAYYALLSEAGKHNLAVIGHLPKTVTPIEGICLGHTDLSHFTVFFDGPFMARYDNPLEAIAGMEAYVSNEAPNVAEQMVKHGTWHTPTLIAQLRTYQRGAIAEEGDPREKYVARSLREQWESFFPVQENDHRAEVTEARLRAYRAGAAVIQVLHERGVPILAGTDLALRDIYPGFSLHDELKLLVKAGLSSAEALQTATVNAAAFLDLDKSHGKIADGYVADIVLLSENPLSDISAVSTIFAVVTRGKFLPGEALDAMLEGVAREADHH